MRDLEPLYAGADARRGATGQAGSRSSGRGGGSGAGGSGRGGAAGHSGAGRGDSGSSGSAGHSGGRGGSGGGDGGGEAPPPGSHPDWNDPIARQNWFNGLKTKRVTIQNEAYAYQHQVLGTDIERKIVSDDGKSIYADSVTPDGTAYTAWDAKHSGGGPKAIHEGTAPSFIQDSAMEEFDSNMRKYEAVIHSSGNPINKLVVVTNTPEAQTYLTQRLQNILRPETPFEVQLIP